ncbi:hypothetical protein BI364_11485 [Acidihalobacter yilgarnensis]|uniref:Transglycosylase SLT domain-containing protein n=1 Tax=Acidihalobacter yilgarnensis TaxID=2819280 RepID=A0A1D8IPU5_9GAMM|nr:transglycosylase SLT domain-containing protein [Acidihalobacter yilgarnensis]AOU98492.1 hypothetical protein BI364_11485 [Acidihalobacter yilgarnensis]
MRAVLPRVLVVLALMITGLSTSVASADSAAQFKAALDALSTNQLDRFEALSRPLIGNILYPYLRYAYLEHEIEHVHRADIDAFLKANAKLPISNALHSDWLLELARRQDWTTFIAEDTGSGGGSRLACARVQALAATGHVDKALTLAKQLWLAGYSQPQSCDPVFSLLTQHDLLTPTLIRQRLLLALDARNISLARFLARKLPSAEQPLAARWLQVYETPSSLLGQPLHTLGPAPERDRILLAAFDHFARRDPAQARHLWVQVAIGKPTLPPAIRDEINRDIALNAAWDGLPQAQAWLDALPKGATNDIVRVWRVRVALRNGNWMATLKHIRAMPSAQRAEPNWQYWEARSLAALGQPAAAEKIARPLAKRFSYYGFLAADFLQSPYATGKPLPPTDPALQHKIAAHYLVRVAFALEKVDQHADAKAAWRAALRRFNAQERFAAAELAYRRGWAYGTYAAAARAGIRNASRLMFPFDQMPHIQAAASHNGLKPGLLLAVMRQESAFQTSVCSDKGACGLLQLLPSTACWIGRQTGLGDLTCSLKALSKPSVNIRAGANYLAYLFKQFDNDAVLALAAYNAGPRTVNRWLSAPAATKPGSARWLATLPYGETRNYVEAVLFNRVVYTRRLGPRSEVKGIQTAPRFASAKQDHRLADALLPQSLTPGVVR